MSLRNEVRAVVEEKTKEFTEMQLDEVEQAIKNFCNIADDEELPHRLKYVWANMVVDLAEYEYAKKNPPVDANSEISLGNVVSNVKILDASITLEGKTVEETLWQQSRASHEAKLDEITMNYSKQLKGCRRPRGYGYGQT